MKILFSTLEVTTMLTNMAEVNKIADAIEKKIAKREGKTLDTDSKKDKAVAIMTFLATEGAEYKDGPLTLTKVKKGVGVTIDESYVVEFTEIYLSSIVPMLKPIAKIAKASQDMATQLKELEAKFA